MINVYLLTSRISKRLVTLTPTHSHPLMLIPTLIQSCSQPLTLTPTHTHTHSPSLTPTYIHSCSQSLTITHTYTLTHTHSHSLTYIHVHTHSHPFTLTPTLTPSLTLTQSYSLTPDYIHSHPPTLIPTLTQTLSNIINPHSHSHPLTLTPTLTPSLTSTHNHTHPILPVDLRWWEPPKKPGSGCLPSKRYPPPPPLSPLQRGTWAGGRGTTKSRDWAGRGAQRCSQQKLSPISKGPLHQVSMIHLGAKC